MMYFNGFQQKAIEIQKKQHNSNET